MTRETVSFGPFSLIASERLLMRGSTPVELSGRALDILVSLASRPNQVIRKRDLIAQVWPDVVVEEGSLRFHVAALRKILGDGMDGARYINTVPGRGYCFVAPISASSSRTDPNSAAPSPLPADNLPPRLTGMVGRADDVRTISTRVVTSRFVSVVGPGGVGKTTVAVAVARDLSRAFAGAVLFVDLGALGNPGLVAASLGSMLELSVQSQDPTSSLIAYLRDKRILLVFDNCEHVIEAAATLTERIFQEASGVHIITTSREPLRAQGEKVHRLPPLLVPPEGLELTAATALTYPAVQLFAERAAASDARFVLRDADVATVANICRRLDGMALAIELAAGRVEGYGLQQTAALLDDRLSLMWLGRRTAPPRQKTLQATLDWSHELLSAVERVVLRRLSVFVGQFTLEAAKAVATSATLDQTQVLGAIDSLVSKSMVVASSGHSAVGYRLLATARAYSHGKLVESGEAEAVARRHAVHYRDLLQQIDTKSAPDNRSEQRAALIEHLGNVRAALEWSLTDRGDVELGIQLAAASAGLFIELSLLTEYRHWTELALSTLQEDMRGSRWEMELQAGLGHSLMHTTGNGEQVRLALERAAEIAEALGDALNQLRVLTRLHMHHRRAGDFGRSLSSAERISAIASAIGHESGKAAANGFLGVSHHLVGKQVEARAHLEAASRGPPQDRLLNANQFGFHFDPQIPLGRVLWLQGYPETAVKYAIAVTKEPMPYRDPVTSCVALIWGMAVFRWTGDWTAVEDCANRMLAQARRHALEPFEAVGLGIEGEIFVVRGQRDRGMELLRESLARLHADDYELYTAEIGCAYAASLAKAGRLDEALESIVDIIASVASRGDSFMTPELLRLKGEFLTQAGDQSGAETCFQRSIALADQQSALSWRLRTAISFARLQIKQGDCNGAQSELARTYARFCEGFETADLRLAKLLLNNTDQAVAC